MIRAHQVLEDLEKQRAFYENHMISDGRQDIALGHIMKLIRNSFKFKFGEYNAMVDMFSNKSLTGSRLFKDDVENLYFPYGLCWFEYEGRPRDFYAVLVVYAHEIRQFTALFFLKSPEVTENFWRLEPLGAEMKIGDNLEGENSNIRILKIWDTGEDLFEMEDQLIEQVIRVPLQFLFMALRLLACKNIGTDGQDPPKKLQKKRAQKGKNRYLGIIPLF